MEAKILALKLVCFVKQRDMDNTPIYSFTSQMSKQKNESKFPIWLVGTEVLGATPAVLPGSAFLGSWHWEHSLDSNSGTLI